VQKSALTLCTINCIVKFIEYVQKIMNRKLIESLERQHYIITNKQKINIQIVISNAFTH